MRARPTILFLLLTAVAACGSSGSGGVANPDAGTGGSAGSGGGLGRGGDKPGAGSGGTMGSDGAVTQDGAVGTGGTGGTGGSGGVTGSDASAKDGPVQGTGDAVIAKLDASPDSATPVDLGADVAETRCAVCTDLRKEYADAVAAAKSCVVGAKDACSISVPSQIACGSCATWINNRANVDVVLKKWETNSCAKCVFACPLTLIACLPLGDGVCEAERLPVTTAATSAPIAVDPVPILRAGTCKDVKVATTN